jgi:hypothetical protein
MATRWATLLTPKRVTLEAPMEGFELDLASPDFQNLMVDNRNVVTPGTYTFSVIWYIFLIWMTNFTDLLANVMPLVEASGSTAISTRFSLPSILNFNQISYINSTSNYIYLLHFLYVLKFTNRWYHARELFSTTKSGAHYVGLNRACKRSHREIDQPTHGVSSQLLNDPAGFYV